jgi:hypothetical protein
MTIEKGLPHKNEGTFIPIDNGFKEKGQTNQHSDYGDRRQIETILLGQMLAEIRGYHHHKN